MKRAICLAATIATVLVVASCRSSMDAPPPDTSETISHPSSSGTGGTGDVAAPAPKPTSTTPYVDETIKEVRKGSVKFDGILSKFKCTKDDQCTSTKYTNAPKTKSECTCQAACTPFVVTKVEARRRKESNERLCGPRQWFGPNCPAPECGFIEFSAFRCHEGMCGGWAEGR